MERSDTKPVILLDVDGPLNPYDAKTGQVPEGYVAHQMHPSGFEHGKGLRVLLRSSDGPMLMATGAELIWATTWGHEANTWIGPHLGLPILPVIDWKPEDRHDVGNLFWKTKRVAQWMNTNRPGVPFIWLDDEVGMKDLDYLKENCGNYAEILRISPKTGITEQDFSYLNKWKAENS